MFGPHFQQSTPNWPAAIVLLPPKTPVKAIDRGDMLREAKIANPGIFTILRHHYDPGQVFGGTYEENKARARAFFETFIDGTFRSQYAKHVDAVEEFNEYFDSRHVPIAQRQWLKDTYGIDFNPEFLQQEYEDRLRWIEAVNNVWTNEYRTQPELAHIRLITGNVPIGNDTPLAYAQVVEEHDGLLGYHPYMLTVNGQLDGSDDLFHSGRWKWNDHYFRSHGAFVKWIGTESGPYTGVLTGWRHSDVCGGNVECLLNVLEAFGNKTAAWNAQHSHRFRGTVLFTTDNLEGTWKWFHIQMPEMSEIALKSQEFPLEDPLPPPPPPPPPPVPTRAYGIDISHWQGAMDWVKAKQRGVQFAFIKATENNAWVDPRYLENRIGAEAEGVLWSPYHYYKPNYDPFEQAEHFWETTQTRGDIRMVLDVEEHGNNPNLGIDVALCLSHLALLSGEKPILYTGISFFNTYLANITPDMCDLWIADWTKVRQDPKLPSAWSGGWRFWQFTSDGNGPEHGASSARIDLNWFNGTYQDLVEYCNMAPAPPPIPQEVHTAIQAVAKYERIQIYPHFALAARILADGKWITSTELEYESNGKQYRYQYAVDPASGQISYYVCIVPNWNKVWSFPIG